MTRFRIALALSASAVALLPGVALAQDRDGPVTRVDDIVVTAAPYGVARQATNIAVEVLDEADLTTAPSTSLGDVLNGLPGVRSTAFAAGAGRPVIRGLAGPRVQVLTNGMGLIDASSLSPDHQVAADPGEANRIEVLRGPQTLAYGGSAIGGVVNVIDGRIAEERPEGGSEGRVWAQTSTVDDGLSFGARGAFAAGPVVLTLDGFRREAGDYEIPVPSESRRQLEAEGEEFEDTGGTTLENSFVDLSAFGAGVSWIGDRGFVGVSVKRTETDYGVPGHAHEEDPMGPPPVEEEELVTIGLEQTRYDLRGELRLPFGPFARLRGGAAYADYTHTEFEGDEVGTVFTSEGVEGRLELVQVRRGGWDGAIGVQALKRDLDAEGDEAYVPATEISELGVYTLQRLDRGGWGLEGGLRLESRELDSLAGARDFSTASASIGAYFKPTDALFLGASISRNGRAPTEAELFAEGPHAATRAFEVGDADLDEEEVTSLEGTLHWDRGPLTIDLHVFNADYDGFIDLVPTGAEEDELPVFQYVQTDATFRGMEAALAYRAWESGTDSLTLELGYDTVRGDTDLGPPARIPSWSLSGRAELEWGPWTLRGQVRHVGEQDRIAAFELPTDSYTTADLYVGWSPREDGLILFAEARNLTDEEVREHTSFLKDLAPSPGRNLRIGAAYRF